MVFVVRGLVNVLFVPLASVQFRCLRISECTLPPAGLGADSVFADAVDEFGKLESVKEKLEGWKRAYPGSYRDAYASLSVPSLFAPYVRLQLLNWDPLFVGGGFDNMNW